MKDNQGYAIPLSLCVAGVTLILGLSVAQLSAGDLGVASSQYYRERALQMANIGLEKGVANGAVAGTFKSGSQTGTHPDDCVQLTVYDNSKGLLPDDSGCPVKVPTGFQYWVSRGEAHSGTRVLASAKVGALVHYGAPLGSAGAQVRYLLSDPGNDPVNFLAQDEKGAPLPDEILCSTEATGLPAANPVGLIKPLTFNHVGIFHGTVQVPKGTDPKEIISFDPRPKPLKVDQQGSPFNIPEYSPPATSRFVPSFSVADGSSKLLVPGHYGSLTLPEMANVQLNGTYVIDKLILAPTANADPGPRAVMKVDTGAYARIYVNHLQSNGRPLGLLNNQPASQFRLNLKPVAPPAAPLHLAILGGSSVAVVAPGHALRLISDDTRVIKGSFCCDTLLLKFPSSPNGVPLATFIYDVSASHARKNRQDGIVGATGTTGTTGGVVITTGGDTTTGDTSDGGTGHSENPGESGSTGGSETKIPTVNEPMILSRQLL